MRPSPTRTSDLAGLRAWFAREGRDLPWRRTRDPYAVLVSEVMLQQTQVARVVERWERWLARWPTPAALAGASLAEVLAEWDGLGYPRRARALWLACAEVAARGWPDDLQALPGVGPYTAAAVRCFAFEEPVLPGDVNVRRVLARRWPDGVDVGADPWACGQALMELGQRFCRARQPLCAECPVAAGCPSFGSVAADPAPGRRAQPRFEGSLRQRRGALLRRVLAEGSVAVDGVDRAAADGLVADGLVVLESGALAAPR